MYSFNFLKAFLIAFAPMIIRSSLKKLYPVFEYNIIANAFNYTFSTFIVIILFLKFSKVKFKYLYSENKHIHFAVNEISLFNSIFSYGLVLSIILFFFGYLFREIESFLRLEKAEYFLLFNNRSIYINFLTSVIVAPICEEVLFRMLILKSFLINYSKRKSIIFTSLIFGLLHYKNSPYVFSFILVSFLFSIILGIVYLNTNNIFYAIFIHILYNCLIYLNILFLHLLDLTIYSINDFYKFVLSIFIIIIGLILCLKFIYEDSKIWHYFKL